MSIFWALIARALRGQEEQLCHSSIELMVAYLDSADGIQDELR